MLTGDTNYIYKNEFDKACFAHDAAYSDSKNLTKRAAADKLLRDKAYKISNNPRNGYERALASMVYKFFDKKSKGTGIKNEIKQNQQLANELHHPIIKKFKKIKFSFSFKDNIWDVDLQLTSIYNKGIRYILCIINLFSKYVWVVPLKHKKGTTIAKAFENIFRKSNNRKPNKI